jgi:hypothetical protein
MKFVFAILACLALAHVIVATTATIVVLRDSSLKRFQVWGKIASSWILIYVGPIFILYVMNEQSPHLVPKYAKKGIIHWLLFAPIKPDPHRYGSNQLDDGSPVGGWNAPHGSGGRNFDSHD